MTHTYFGRDHLGHNGVEGWYGLPSVFGDILHSSKKKR